MLWDNKVKIKVEVKWEGMKEARGRKTEIRKVTKKGVKSEMSNVKNRKLGVSREKETWNSGIMYL